MNIKNYLKDKIPTIMIFIVISFISILLLKAFKTNSILIFSILILYTLFLLTHIIMDYCRKNNFYKKLFNNIESLDKSFLVLETLDEPDFYEGKLLFQALYDINKSYLEDASSKERQIKDFKEYIELWIHEVKTPIASLVLMSHNHKNELDYRYIEQLKKIENYVEQVLYYTRSENAHKDYLIKEVPLNKIINNLALKYKDDLLEENIDFIVEKTNCKVYTDSKWLEFILGQIISNSIKYRSLKKDSFIKISTKENNKTVSISIEDNGIGIPEYDINSVFEKSFTGQNGRKTSTSTGMGLYISKNLCKLLGHKISIESKKNQFTNVTITFFKNEFYDVLD